MFLTSRAIALASLILAAPLARAQCWGPAPQRQAVAYPRVIRVIHPAPAFVPMPPPASVVVARPVVVECSTRCGCEKCGKGCACASSSCGDGSCVCLTAGAEALPPESEAATHGVNTDKVGKAPRITRHRHGGCREVSREEAFGLVETGGVPDDAAKPWVVFVLPPDRAKAALAEWASSRFAKYRASHRTQSFDASHWYASAKGFKEGVYVMRADGAEARHLPAFDAAALLKELERPSAPQPSPAGPQPDARPDWLKALPPWAPLALGGLALLLILLKKDEPK